MFFGPDGDGTLTISDGGKVTTGLARVGSDPAPTPAGAPGRGTEFVTIEGTLLSSSEWHVTGSCDIGLLEPSTLRLEGQTIGPLSVGGATLRVDDTLTVGVKGFVRGNGTLVAPTVVGNNSSARMWILKLLCVAKAKLAAALLPGQRFPQLEFGRRHHYDRR